MEAECAQLGVPLLRKVYDEICEIGREHDVEPLAMVS
jgi:hypothetical protein